MLPVTRPGRTVAEQGSILNVREQPAKATVCVPRRRPPEPGGDAGVRDNAQDLRRTRPRLLPRPAVWRHARLLLRVRGALYWVHRSRYNLQGMEMLICFRTRLSSAALGSNVEHAVASGAGFDDATAPAAALERVNQGCMAVCSRRGPETAGLLGGLLALLDTVVATAERRLRPQCHVPVAGTAQRRIAQAC
jgi:hypothetical protein